MVIIETSVFTRQVDALLSDEEYRKLQEALVGKPTLGSLIRGSGGVAESALGPSWQRQARRGMGNLLLGSE